jgi:hypothetical protein
MPGTAVGLDTGCVETVKPLDSSCRLAIREGRMGVATARPAFQTQRRPLVFTNVTVIDTA